MQDDRETVVTKSDAPSRYAGVSSKDSPAAPERLRDRVSALHATLTHMSASTNEGPTLQTAAQQHRAALVAAMLLLGTVVGYLLAGLILVIMATLVA